MILCVACHFVSGFGHAGSYIRADPRLIYWSGGRGAWNEDHEDQIGSIRHAVRIRDRVEGAVASAGAGAS